MRRLLEQLKMAATEKQRRDYEAYLAAFEDAIAATGAEYNSTELGTTPDGEILLFQPAEENDGRHLLVIAGQHGEELAPPWALLAGIRQNAALLRAHNIAFLPVGNPHGFRTGERNGYGGKRTNWFMDKELRPRRGSEVGPEIQALIDAREVLCNECAVDGLLNMHEDNTSLGFYLYVLGEVEDPCVRGMLRAGRRFFEFKKNGRYSDNGSYELEDGIVDNHADHSFDHYAYLEGVPLAITMELPAAEGVEFEKRVAAGAAMLGMFLRDRCGAD